MASDFHTHQSAPAFRALISSPALLTGQLTSLEFHPWHLPDHFALKYLPDAGKLNRFAALGEIGLDKCNGAPYDLQRQYFQALLALAYELKKPVVIHCVRSYQELFEAIKPFAGLKILFHGFRSSPQMLDELWKRQITVSFHPLAVDNETLMMKLPTAAGAFGFESDDDPAISIARLLDRAREITGIKNIEAITDQNFTDFLEI